MKTRRFHLTLRTWALAALMAWVLFGCSRCRQGDEPLTDSMSPPIPTPTEPGDVGGTPLSDRPLSQDSVIIQELGFVYFAYDSDILDAEATQALESNAQWLRENPDISVLIEGHCDERGTDEYNYALGERRANSVLTYLRNLDVPNSLYTRSYGETRPAVEGHDESAWRFNRRVQFSGYAE